MSQLPIQNIHSGIAQGNTQRLKYIFAGFANSMTDKQIVELSSIHPWFVHKLRSTWNQYQSGELQNLVANSVFKMVDTCAGEFEAFTPFFYSTKNKNTLESSVNNNEAQDFLYNRGMANFDYLIDQAKRDGRELVLDAVIFNSYNKLFVQKRRSDRQFLPNCWGLVGGYCNHINREDRQFNSICEALDSIIFEDTGWHNTKIRSLLEIRDWEYNGVSKRTVVFDVQVNGDMDVPRLDLGKVKGFLWIDSNDLDIFGINKTYEENLMYQVCKKALDMHNNPKKVIIIGSGPIRIGQGVEFDYLTVHAVRALQKRGIKAIIVNNNPETVSTDYSISDRLYFEPLTAEFVANVCENEKQGLLGVIAQFGGQTSINLAKPLENMGIKILGTDASAIDLAEDRELTGQIMNKLGYAMPDWTITHRKNQIIPKANEVGYPVLIRPSFVLGGDGMKIVYSNTEVEDYLKAHFEDTPDNFEFDNPILIDKFLDDALEVDIDFITDGNKTYCFILEQLEKAGIHSGDSSCVFPSQSIPRDIMDKLVDMTRAIAKEFKVIGIGNLQVAIKNSKIYIIEVNPRASRTVPFVSKCLGFSLTELATRVILGEELPEFNFDLEYYKNPQYAWSLRQSIVHKEQPIRYIAPKFVAIKHPVFCLHKLDGVNQNLGPLMKSTGEAMTVGKTFEEAKAKWSLNKITQLPKPDLSNCEVYCV